VKFLNLTFRTYDNPQTTPLNLSKVGQAEIENCVVDTGTGGGAQSQPTHNAAGIIMPENNNWVISRIRNVDVRGYNVGYQLYEHSDVDDARVWMCNYGWYFPGSTHGIHMGATVTTACTRGVISGPTGGWVQRLDWSSYQAEHSILSINSFVGDSTWANTVVDFADTNSVLRGIIHFATVSSGVGASDTLTVLGTTNVTFYNENNHSFTGLKVSPLATNDSLTYPLLEATRSNGVPIFAMGQLAQPFDSFSALWLGSGQARDTVSVATNFTIAGDGTNLTAINVGQPLGGTAAKSVVQIQVGHITRIAVSNDAVYVLQPMTHGFMATSNFISGQTVVNPYAGPLHLIASIQLTTAAVTGNAAMALRIPGTATNVVGFNTAAATPANTGIFQELIGDVPPGASFVFTNTSVGVGNSVTLFTTEVKGD
jgi:hypothetical protein